MTPHTVDSSYKQFYVADIGLDPDAPEEWTDVHIEQRFNAQKNIVALCPEGDISARIISVPPGQKYEGVVVPEFKVSTEIIIESGKLGVFGFPWELLEEYEVQPGKYKINFSGFLLEKVNEEADYYVVEVEDV